MSPDSAPSDTDIPPTGPDRRRSRANRWLAALASMVAAHGMVFWLRWA